MTFKELLGVLDDNTIIKVYRLGGFSGCGTVREFMFFSNEDELGLEVISVHNYLDKVFNLVVSITLKEAE